MIVDNFETNIWKICKKRCWPPCTTLWFVIHHICHSLLISVSQPFFSSHISEVVHFSLCCCKSGVLWLCFSKIILKVKCLVSWLSAVICMSLHRVWYLCYRRSQGCHGYPTTQLLCTGLSWLPYGLGSCARGSTIFPGTFPKLIYCWWV